MALNNASQVPREYAPDTMARLFRNIDQEARRVTAYSGVVTWNPGNILDGDQDSTTVTVPGVLANVKAHVKVFAPYTLAGLSATGYVSADNTVTILLQNNSGGAVDLGSGEWGVTVENWIA